MASACTVRLGRAERCPRRCSAGRLMSAPRLCPCVAYTGDAFLPGPSCPECGGLGWRVEETSTCPECGGASVLHEPIQEGGDDE